MWAVEACTIVFSRCDPWERHAPTGGSCTGGAGAGGRSSARLAYSFVSPAEIEEGVERLAAAIPARIGV
jgi:DNA-binding transcriptional MocR family regulator